MLLTENIEDNVSLKMPNCTIISFDIFDTLITRKTATPKGIFALMQTEILTNNLYATLPLILKQDFYNIRIEAEQYTREVKYSKLRTREVTFDEIYDFIGFNYSIDAITLGSLKELELKIEKQNIVPIRKNISFLNELVRNSKKVLLISDMYYSKERIKFLLEGLVESLDKLEIFVSADNACSKGNGLLYELIQKTFNIQFEDWLHIGDNKHSDYDMALSRGITARLSYYPKFTSYENYLLDKYANNNDVQMLLGLIKNIRLFNNIKNNKENLGMSLAGPILYGYVKWIIETSIQQNIKRLYFIARDGFILKKIADIIIEKENLDIKTKYIYGSRIAWRTPSIVSNKDNIEELVDALLTDFVSISDITGLSVKELSNVIDKKYINKALTLKDKTQLKSFLLANNKFIDLLIDKNIEKRELLIRYLKQEIDFSDSNFAFVDLTGSGRTNNRLFLLINQFYREKCKSFYMQTSKNVASDEYCERYVYMFVNRAFKWVEILSRAPHGQTIGYQEKCGKIYPICEKINIKDFNNWHYLSYLNGIKLFAHSYNNGNINPAIIKEYCKLVGSSYKEIRDAFANFKFSCVGINENSEFAPKISIIKSLKVLLFNETIDTNNMQWSLNRSSKSVVHILKFKEKYGSIRKFLIHISYIRKNKEFYIRFLGLKLNLGGLIWG